MLIKCKHKEQQRYEDSIRQQFTSRNDGEAREAAEIIAKGVQATVKEMRRGDLK